MRPILGDDVSRCSHSVIFFFCILLIGHFLHSVFFSTFICLSCLFIKDIYTSVSLQGETQMVNFDDCVVIFCFCSLAYH